MDLSKPVNKLLTILLVAFVACQNSKNTNEDVFNEKITEKVCLMNFDSEIYNKGVDSIKSWIENKLSNYLDCRAAKWQLDSCMEFNHTRTRVLMALKIQMSVKEISVADNMSYFHGVKINNKWFFFRGGTYHVPREHYIDTTKIDIHVPFTFKQLHNVALKLIYKGYIIELPVGNKNTKKRFVISEQNFDETTPYHGEYVDYGGCKTCKTSDDYFLYLVKENWEHKDSSLNLK